MASASISRSRSLASAIAPEQRREHLDLLRLGIHPVVPAQGSVGASGDLAADLPVAHDSQRAAMKFFHVERVLDRQGPVDRSDLALVQHNHPLGGFHDRAHDVFDPQDGESQPVPQAADELHRLTDLLGVEPAQHLIEHQQLGLRGDRPGHFEALFLDHVEVAGLEPREFGQSDEAQFFAGEGLDEGAAARSAHPR
mgnify:CR=1 FL=1